MGLISRVSSRTYRNSKKNNQTMTKTYRLSEIKSHNTKKSSWMVIHNKVYNITDFISDHPGGEEVLLDLAGQECTEAFEDIGHSNDARDILADLFIGDLHEDDCVKSNPKVGNYSWQPEDRKGGEKEANTTMFVVAAVVAVVAGLAWNHLA